MLASYAKMDFSSFFVFHGKPGIFFAVELGALATVPVMMILFRRYRQPVAAEEYTEVKNLVPTYMLVGLVATLIFVSFFPNKPDITNGAICITFAVVSIIFDYAKRRDGDRTIAALKDADIETLLLLFGLFIVIAGLTEVGVIKDLSDLIVRTGGSNMFLLYTIIVWGSILISAFVDNIPYVATMLPVLQGVTATLGVDPTLLYLGLLCGATLGGNLTPVGASANITAVGILRKNGEIVTFKEFMKIGVPFTLTAATVGYAFIWFIYG